MSDPKSETTSDSLAREVAKVIHRFDCDDPDQCAGANFNDTRLARQVVEVIGGRAWDLGVDAAFRGAIMRQNADDVKRRNPYRGDEEEDYGPGCDCTELCSMGPTCPGGILAGLPDAGCWRTPAPVPVAAPDEGCDRG